MPMIPAEHISLEDAISKLGPVLMGSEWIDKLTAREQWLVDKYNSDSVSGSSIVRGHIHYPDTEGNQIFSKNESGNALRRDETMRSQHEQAEEWLGERGLLYETDDGTTCVTCVPCKAFGVALAVEANGAIIAESMKVSSDITDKKHLDDRLKYSVDSDGHIRALGRLALAPEAEEFSDLGEGCTFDAALQWAGGNWLKGADLNLSRGWISNLKRKWHLDIEEGVYLVTGVICREIPFGFSWKDEAYFPIRPDYGRLLIENRFNVSPLNKTERRFLSRFVCAGFKVFPSLWAAIDAGELTCSKVMPFDWWVDFWTKRGIAIQEDKLETAPTPPLDGGGNDVASRSAEQELRLEPANDDNEIYKTGLPGRPTSWHLIEAEVRNNSQKYVGMKTAEVARSMRSWIQSEHCNASPPTIKTLTNRLPELLQKLRTKPEQRS